MIKETMIPIESYGHWNAGKLGAIIHAPPTNEKMLFAMIDVAENRILRLEAALRQSGIDVDGVDFPV